MAVLVNDEASHAGELLLLDGVLLCKGTGGGGAAARVSSAGACGANTAISGQAVWHVGEAGSEVWRAAEHHELVVKVLVVVVGDDSGGGQPGVIAAVGVHAPAVQGGNHQLCLQAAHVVEWVAAWRDKDGEVGDTLVRRVLIQGDGCLIAAHPNLCCSA